jgi:hypothetical protein
MRKMDPNELDAMKEEEMESTFDASRDVCRRARNTVLSEPSQTFDNSRQLPTIDK